MSFVLGFDASLADTDSVSLHGRLALLQDGLRLFSTTAKLHDALLRE